MTGIIISFLLPVFIIGLLVMALLQMLGGKFIAKLEHATYGSALLISLFSFLGTGAILALLAKMGLFSNVGLYIVFTILLSIASLVYVTKLKWKCSDFITAVKASSLSIIVTVIIWIVILSKLSEFLKVEDSVNPQIGLFLFVIASLVFVIFTLKNLKKEKEEKPKEIYKEKEEKPKEIYKEKEGIPYWGVILPIIIIVVAFLFIIDLSSSN